MRQRERTSEREPAREAEPQPGEGALEDLAGLEPDAALSPEDVLDLQRAAGNAALGRALLARQGGNGAATQTPPAAEKPEEAASANGGPPPSAAGAQTPPGASGGQRAETTAAGAQSPGSASTQTPGSAGAQAPGAGAAQAPGAGGAQGPASAGAQTAGSGGAVAGVGGPTGAPEARGREAPAPPKIGPAPPPPAAPSPPSTPTMRTPRLAAAAQRIVAAITNQQTTLYAAGIAQRDSLLATGEARATQLESLATLAADQLEADLQGRIGAVQITLAGIRDAIRTTTETEAENARGDEATALDNLTSGLDARRDETLTAAGDEATATEATAETEIARVTQSEERTAAQITAAAQKEIDARTGDKRERVQDALKEPLQAAHDELHGNSQKVIDGVVDTISKTAREIRGSGDKAADNLGSGQADVERGIHDATAAAVEQIGSLVGTNVAQVDAMAPQILDGLRTLGAAAAPKLRTEGAAWAAAARESAALAAEGADRVLSSGMSELERAGTEALDELQGPVVTNPESFAAEVVRVIDGGGAEVQSALTQTGPDLDAHLSAAEDSLVSTLDVIGATVRRGADDTLTSLTETERQIVGEVEQQASEIRDLAGEAHTGALKKFDDELVKQVKDARKGFTDQREGGQKKVIESVDKGIKGHSDLASRVTEQFADVAKDAADPSIWRGIWRGFTGFLEGLAWFLGGVLVVAGLIWLGALAIGAGIAFGLALLIALVVVGLVMLVYSFVTSVIARIRQIAAHYNLKWWEWIIVAPYIGALGVLDTFGVSGMIEGGVGRDLATFEKLDPEERARRFTNGALTLVTIGLLRALMKGRGPGSGRGVPEPRRLPPGETRQLPPGETGDRPPTGTDRPPTEPTTERPPTEPTTDRPPTEPTERPPEQPPPVQEPPSPYNENTPRDVLEADRNPAPRQGETADQATQRARWAQAELGRRAQAIFDALPEQAPHVEMAANEGVNGAHVIEKHSPDIPMERALDANGDPTGARTVEGRLFGDPPWGEADAQNVSSRWFSIDLLNQTVNRYIRAHWDTIRLDLATEQAHRARNVDAGQPIGDGYYNRNRAMPNTAGQPPRPVLIRHIRHFRIVIRYNPGGNPPFTVHTAFPDPPPTR